VYPLICVNAKSRFPPNGLPHILFAGYAHSGYGWGEIGLEAVNRYSSEQAPKNAQGPSRPVRTVLGRLHWTRSIQCHASATVIQNSEGMLLRFSPVSAFAGKQLFFPAPTRMSLYYYFLSLFTIPALIAQKLR
jgi:hypothetical protein